MSIFTRIYGSTFDTYGTTTGSATYALARSGTPATSGNATATTGPVGQVFTSPTYACRQVFLRFDTSAAAAGTGTIGVNCATVATVTGDFIEASEVPSSSNKIAGDSLSSLTMLGSVAMPMATGRYSIPLSGTPTITSDLRYLLSARKERLNTAPTGTDSAYITLADFAGTTSDPYLDIAAGTAWDYVGTGTSVQATATSHILTEPAGVAAGDLLVACIGSRIASATQITLPSGWTLVSQQLNNNILSTSSAAPSAMMAYIVRGASPPALTFTHPVAPSVALGRVFAYRNVDQTTPLDASTGATSVTGALTAATGSALATTQDDDLLVMLAAGGQEGTWSGFGATGTGTSGTTADSVLDPQFDATLERSDILTTTGVDMSLAVADAIKSATAGSIFASATTTVAAANVMIVGAFKLAPPAPTGTTYNETVAETATAAETLTATVVVPIAVSIAETAGAADTTDASVVAAPIITTVAETAAAAETITPAISFTKSVAETAAATETQAGTLVTAKAIAETASAADTVGGLLARIGAIAESTSAAETISKTVSATAAVAESASAAEATDASVVPASGAFNETVAESTSVTDTVGAGGGGDASVDGILTAYTPGSDRNDFDGEVGVRLGIGAAGIPVTHLGVRTHAGATGTRTLKLYEWFSGAVERSVTVDLTGHATDEYVWGEVAPITLGAGGYYALTMVVSAGGPVWSNPGPTTYEASIVNVYDSYKVTGGALATGGANSSFVGLDLGEATGAYNGGIDGYPAFAEAAVAAETLGGLLVTAKAIAESASAAETVGGLAVRVGAVAETAAAAETITRTLTYTGAIAETASAADTVGGLLVRNGAVVETASAAETVAGLLTFTRAVAETAGAAETITYSVTGPAGTVYNEAQAETVSAADTVGSLAVRVGAIAETAAAVETIVRAVSFTKAVAETASAADTVGGLLLRNGTIAEAASAADTTAGLAAFSRAIAEAASAAETITYSVTGPAGTVYNVTVAETANAADTVVGPLIRVGAIADSASAVETITRAVSYTRSVAETAAAAETVGVLAVRVGAVAETAAAVDTIANTLTVTGAIVEAASAAETIKAGGTKPDTVDLIGTLDPTIPLTGRLLTPVAGLVGQQLQTAAATGQLSSATTMIGRYLPKRSLTGTTNG